MNNWSFQRKQQARFDTLPRYVFGQYWTLCGSGTAELAYLLSQRVITPGQWHGVDRSASAINANRSAMPGVSWHHGDLLDVMRKHKGFNPGCVNADLVQTVDTAGDYVARIMHLIEPYDCTLVVNFVMGYRNRDAMSPDHVVDTLGNKPQFRHALRNGWKYDNRCYLYAGRSTTIMGTFVFKNMKFETACA